MMANAFREMILRLFRGQQESHAAKSVEVFGWLILLEGTAILLFPNSVASLLQLPPLVEQASNYFRLAGVLVGGLGILYVASGRLNAQGFVFASLLDRPLVPIIMGILWYLDILPGALALAFSIQDFASFLWTLSAWSIESRK